MREDRHINYMRIAFDIAKRSTCARRSVGCILVDEAGVILSLGHNGVAKGDPHCNEGHPCKGADADTTTRLDECLAIHAEMNALMFCESPQRIYAVYVTASPCIHCMKILRNTTANAIYYSEEYDLGAINYWKEGQGRIALHLQGYEMIKHKESESILHEVYSSQLGRAFTEESIKAVEDEIASLQHIGDYSKQRLLDLAQMRRVELSLGG